MLREQVKQVEALKYSVAVNSFDCMIYKNNGIFKCIDKHQKGHTTVGSCRLVIDFISYIEFQAVFKNFNLLNNFNLALS